MSVCLTEGLVENVARGWGGFNLLQPLLHALHPLQQGGLLPLIQGVRNRVLLRVQARCQNAVLCYSRTARHDTSNHAYCGQQEM